MDYVVRAHRDRGSHGVKRERRESRMCPEKEGVSLSDRRRWLGTNKEFQDGRQVLLQCC
jgi:hypothetical protein